MVAVAVLGYRALETKGSVLVYEMGVQLNFIVLLAFGGFVKEVIGCIRHQGLGTDICWLGTSGRRRDPAASEGRQM